jgi:serine/threonine protein kinase
MEEINNEVRAINKLSGGHKNLVKIISHGWLPLSSQSGTQSRCYYIDMELCDYSLEQYIADPYLGRKLRDAWTDAQTLTEILSIMKQITMAVQYIHT